MMYRIGYVWKDRIIAWYNIENNDDWNYVPVARDRAAKRYSYTEAQLGILFLTSRGGEVVVASDNFVIIPEDLLCFTG